MKTRRLFIHTSVILAIIFSQSLANEYVDLSDLRDSRTESKHDSQDSRDLGESKNSLDCHEMLCISRNDGIVDSRESHAESKYDSRDSSNSRESNAIPPPTIKMMI